MINYTVIGNSNIAQSIRHKLMLNGIQSNMELCTDNVWYMSNSDMDYYLQSWKYLSDEVFKKIAPKWIILYRKQGSKKYKYVLIEQSKLDGNFNSIEINVYDCPVTAYKNIPCAKLNEKDYLDKIEKNEAIISELKSQNLYYKRALNTFPQKENIIILPLNKNFQILGYVGMDDNTTPLNKLYHIPMEDCKKLSDYKMLLSNYLNIKINFSITHEFEHICSFTFENKLYHIYATYKGIYRNKQGNNGTMVKWFNINDLKDNPYFKLYEKVFRELKEKYHD